MGAPLPDVRLPRIKREILAMLCRRPATASRILAHVYQLRPQPPQRSVIKAHVCQINRALAPFGLCVRADRDLCRHETLYRVRKTKGPVAGPALV